MPNRQLRSIVSKCNSEMQSAYVLSSRSRSFSPLRARRPSVGVQETALDLAARDGISLRLLPLLCHRHAVLLHLSTAEMVK